MTDKIIVVVVVMSTPNAMNVFIIIMLHNVLIMVLGFIVHKGAASVFHHSVVFQVDDDLDHNDDQGYVGCGC
jgi:hypothetical protein